VAGSRARHRALDRPWPACWCVPTVRPGRPSARCGEPGLAPGRQPL